MSYSVNVHLLTTERHISAVSDLYCFNIQQFLYCT